MREVLVDQHKTEAILQVSGLQFGHNEAEDAYYAAMLARHGVTQAQFDSSLVWYTNHPHIFDKIYPKVLKQLEAEQAAFLASHAEELAPRVDDEPYVPAPRSAEETKHALDSLIWTMHHGLPSSWHVYPQPAPTVPYK